MTHETNPALVLGILVVIAGLLFVHLARRYPLMRTRVVHTEDITFTALQRVMHWVIGCACAVLVLTGLPVYLAQFLVIPSVSTPLTFYLWGLQVSAWRTYHIYLGLAVVGLCQDECLR
jgi:cytochrome b subunit of formate dehydrogenase